MHQLFDGYKPNKNQTEKIVSQFEKIFLDIGKLMIDKLDLKNTKDPKNIKKVTEFNVKRAICKNMHLFSYAVHLMNENDFNIIKKYYIENFTPTVVPEEDNNIIDDDLIGNRDPVSDVISWIFDPFYRLFF